MFHTVVVVKLCMKKGCTENQRESSAFATYVYRWSRKKVCRWSRKRSAGGQGKDLQVVKEKVCGWSRKRFILQSNTVNDEGGLISQTATGIT